MRVPSELKDRIECQFDAYCKRTLSNAIKDAYRKKTLRQDNEVSFDKVSKKELNHFTVNDTYDILTNYITVLNFTVEIEHDILYEALLALKQKNRNIVILRYWLDMTDREIAELLKLSKSTVNETRIRTVEKLKKIMEV